jgi:ketopantoate hydroxymethyltransferase
VGDSLGMVVLGRENTLPVIVEALTRYIQGVRAGAFPSAQESYHAGDIVADVRRRQAERPRPDV